MKSHILIAALLLTVAAAPAAAVSDKPIPLCVDDVTGQPVKPKSSSVNCPKGSHEVPAPTATSFLRTIFKL